MHSTAHFGRGNLAAGRDGNLGDPVGAFGDAFRLGVGFGIDAIQLTIATADHQFLAVVDKGNTPSRFLTDFDLAGRLEAGPFEQMHVSATIAGGQLGTIRRDRQPGDRVAVQLDRLAGLPAARSQTMILPASLPAMMCALSGATIIA